MKTLIDEIFDNYIDLSIEYSKEEWEHDTKLAMEECAKIYHEREVEKLFIPKYKQAIKDLLQIYLIDIDENGQPKASVTEIMKVIDEANDLILK